MRFASLLADNLHHSSIKVYHRAVRSIHIDNGLPDPLVNCLQLQRLLRGIKRVQGSSPPSHLPITVGLLQIIQRSLDLKFYALDSLVSCVQTSSPLTLCSTPVSILRIVTYKRMRWWILLVFEFKLRLTHFALAVSST